MELLEVELKQIISNITRCRASRIHHLSKVRDDLGIDSFSALEILVSIENRYNIRIPESRLTQLQTFGDIVFYVLQKVDGVRCLSDKH